MKKVFGIVLALALVLTAAVASVVPAAAVSPPITVVVDEPLIKEEADYTITFHNVGTLIWGWDYIDVMFPAGTDVSGCSGVTLTKGPTALTADTTPCGPGPFVWILSPTTIRIGLDGCNITKCEYVQIIAENITNPVSCNYHLEVGTSVHTPVDSEEYTIYCAKVDLVGGPGMKNLISLPCYPDDESIEVVLKTLFDEVLITAGTANPFSFCVWYYDTEEAEWYKYCSDTSFDDLETIEPGKAYWIKPAYGITFWIHGDPYPSDQGPPEKWCYPFCWNMVGYACTDARLATEYLKYTKLPPAYIEAVIAIWYWDEIGQKYADTGWDPSIPNGTMLEPGRGYWMAFLGWACIIPPVDCDC